MLRNRLLQWPSNCMHQGLFPAADGGAQTHNTSPTQNTLEDV